MRRRQRGEPVFVHCWFNHRDNKHSVKDRTKLNRHLIFDIILYKYYDLLFRLSSCYAWHILKVPQIIGFGFNCGFPPSDIVHYVVYYLRRCGYTKARWKFGVQLSISRAHRYGPLKHTKVGKKRYLRR